MRLQRPSELTSTDRFESPARHEQALRDAEHAVKSGEGKVHGLGANKETDSA